MDKRLTGLLVVFFLAFGLFTSLVVFNKPLSRLIRASQEITPSVENSLILAWPLTVKADGQAATTVTVFLRNEKNYPVPNRSVSVSSTIGSFRENELTTDKGGKAEFHLISNTAGVAEISATTGPLRLVQKISVKFE